MIINLQILSIYIAMPVRSINGLKFDLHRLVEYFNLKDKVQKIKLYLFSAITVDALCATHIFMVRSFYG